MNQVQQLLVKTEKKNSKNIKDFAWISGHVFYFLKFDKNVDQKGKKSSLWLNILRNAFHNFSYSWNYCNLYFKNVSDNCVYYIVCL